MREWWRISMFNHFDQFITWLLLFTTSFSFSILASSPLLADDPITIWGTNLGTPVSEFDIQKHSITIFPDDAHLSPGQDRVEQGGLLYKTKCLMFHGEKGIEGPAARLVGNDGWFNFSDPLRVLRIRKYPILPISVDGLWSHATTIYDYIRRAMPQYAPKSLTSDEVYTLTTYILYLNDLVDKNIVLDKQSILEVTMPAKQRSISVGSDITT